MAASTVATTFTVDGAEALIKALDVATRSEKEFEEEMKGIRRAFDPLTSSLKDFQENVSSAFRTESAKDFQAALSDVEEEERGVAAAAKDMGGSSRNAFAGAFTSGTRLGGRLKALKNQVFGIAESFKHLGGVAKFAIGAGLVGAFAAGAAAVAGMVKGVTILTRELKKGWVQAKSFEKTMAVMKVTFAEAAKSGKELSFGGAVKSMEKLYKTTLFTKEQIAKVQASIGRTTRDQERFLRATQLSLDIAAAKPEMTPESVAQWMTTVLGDPGRTADKFRRMEIQVSTSYQEAVEQLVNSGRLEEAQDSALDQISRRFSGASQEVLKTTAGDLEQLGKVWMDLMREGSEAFAKKFGSGAKDFTKVLEDGREIWISTLKEAAEYTSGMAESFGDMLKIATAIQKIRGETSTGDKSVDSTLGAVGNAATKGSGMGALKGVGVIADTVNYYSGGVEGQKPPTIAQLGLGPILGALSALSSRRQSPQESGFRLEEGANAAARLKALAEERAMDAERISGRVDFYERAERHQAKVKQAEKDRAAALADYTRSLKRVQVYYRDTETHWEKYRNQLQKINEVRNKAAATGQMTPGLDASLTELQKRLYQTAVDIQNAPAIAAKEKRDKESAASTKRWADRNASLLERNDPLTPIKKMKSEFESLLAILSEEHGKVAAGGDLTARGKSAERGMASIAERMKTFMGQDLQKKQFQSQTMGLDNLYSSIRSAVLSGKSPEVKAIDKLTEQEKIFGDKFLSWASSIVSKLGPARAAP